MPIKYANGKIYMIIAPNLNLRYIGSTVNALKSRFHGHKSKFTRRGKTDYISSFQVLEDKDAYIELIENYPCNNKEELENREGFLIRQMDCVNINIAGRSSKQYYQDNRDAILQTRKNHYIDNRDRILVYKKDFYKTNSERILESMRQRNLAKKLEDESLCLDILFMEI